MTAAVGHPTPGLVKDRRRLDDGRLTFARLHE